MNTLTTNNKNRNPYKVPLIATFQLRVESGFSTSGITEEVLIDSEVVDIP